MTDVLIVGDTECVPEMRHEVPLMIPTCSSTRSATAGGSSSSGRWRSRGSRRPGAGSRPIRSRSSAPTSCSGRGSTPTRTGTSSPSAARGLGIESAIVPRQFPLAAADELRRIGVELTVDQKHFDDRRRVKTESELDGIRRAQRATDAAMGEAFGLLRRAEPRNGALELDGAPLTCELLKQRVQAVFLRHGAFSDEPIVSHGPQTAVGHDTGSGPIAADDVILVDLFPKDLESACYADMTRTFAVGRSRTRSASTTGCAKRRSTGRSPASGPA